MTAPTKPRMKVRWVEFNTVEAATYNPRVDLLPGDAEWQQIEASLDEYGQVEPLVLNEHNHRLIGGHQRMKILQYKGETGAHMSVVKIADETREKALNVALNQGGRWDLDKLTTLMGELDPAGLAVVTGFDKEALGKMAADLERHNALDLLQSGSGGIEPGGPKSEAEYRPDKLEAWEVTLAFNPEDRAEVQHAIAHAKELWGCPTTAAAFVEICRHFRQQAEA